jgi:hypothetical protein
LIFMLLLAMVPLATPCYVVVGDAQNGAWIMDKIDYKSPLKEWRRPVLRKLPIAEASTGNIKPSLNEGVGGGKGNAGASIS